MSTRRVNPLREADYVLNSCGRRLAPPGATWIDLPYVLPFHSSIFENAAPVTPAQGRVANNSKADFHCMGVVIQSPVGVRVRWPSGRYMQQGPTWTTPAVPGNPVGTGGNMIAFDEPTVIERGAKIAIEMSGGTAGLVDLEFWGVLRYQLMVTPDIAAAGDLPRSIPDPIDELERLPRYRCGPPQNIMAPEWLLGNQCTPETPAGFEDEPFTFLSPVITVGLGLEVFGTAVITPGADDIIVKRWRAITDYSGLDGGASTIPVFGLRLPNGYSITGGDLVPTPHLFWIPAFPTFRLHPGDRMILDVADMQPVGTGSVSTVFEFDGVKRKKAAV